MYYPELLANAILTPYVQIFTGAVAFEALANHGDECSRPTEKLLPS